MIIFDQNFRLRCLLDHCRKMFEDKNLRDSATKKIPVIERRKKRVIIENFITKYFDKSVYICKIVQDLSTEIHKSMNWFC